VSVKWLAAEALRGTGAILLNGRGERFCNELGHRDYVTGEMNKGKGPYRLVLNSACAKVPNRYTLFVLFSTTNRRLSGTVCTTRAAG
jgi:hypothetical protein